MKIWLVSIFEQTPIDETPTTRFNTIAEIAIKLGYQVTFFASTFKHNTKSFRFSETKKFRYKEDLDLVYIKSKSYKENISLKRLFAHYDYSKNLVSYIDRLEKPDIVFLAFPPISIAFEMAKWCKINKVPLVIDIIDPWPDLFLKRQSIKPNFLKHLLLLPLRQRVKFSFNNCIAVTGISEQYISWAKSYCPKIPFSSCFYPAVDLENTQAEILKIKKAKSISSDKRLFTIIYAGSLASSYDIETILKAAKKSSEQYGKNIQFLIAGSGPKENLIRDYQKEQKNLNYLGRLSKPDLMEAYASSDLGLTQHIKGATQSVTYKLFDLLSCGIPILNSLESEMNSIILENKVGLFNRPGDSETLFKNIEMFFLDPKMLEDYKKNAVRITRKLGDSKVVYKDLINFLVNVANETDTLKYPRK